MCVLSVISLILSFQLLASRGLLQVFNSDDLLALDSACFLLLAFIQYVVPCLLGCTITSAKGKKSGVHLYIDYW